MSYGSKRQGCLRTKKILGQSGTNALGEFVHLIPKR